MQQLVISLAQVIFVAPIIVAVILIIRSVRKPARLERGQKETWDKRLVAALSNFGCLGAFVGATAVIFVRIMVAIILFVGAEFVCMLISSQLYQLAGTL